MLNRIYINAFVVFVLLLLCESSLFMSRCIGVDTEQGVKGQLQKPVVSIIPKEIDFGVIGPSAGAKGTFVIHNEGPDEFICSVVAPDGWIAMDTDKLSFPVKEEPYQITIHISSLKESAYNKEVRSASPIQLPIEASVEKDELKQVFPVPIRLEENDEDIVKNVFFPVQMTITANNKIVTYRKRMTSGTHREMLKLTSDRESKSFFVRFELISAKSQPIINVDPVRLDFGTVGSGEQVVRRVKVINRGMGTLKWRATVKDDTKADVQPKPGRYISFYNENIIGTANYVPPAHLKDKIDMVGKWSELGGYPSSDPNHNIFVYRFNGTGISVFFSGEPDGGDLTTYCRDDKNVSNQNCHAKQNERVECLVAEGLANTAHTLTLLSKVGHVVIEGIRIYGKDMMVGNHGWISIFPNSGTTTKEMDFVNIMLNTQQFHPGLYGGNASFDSNGGQATVEICLEVSKDNIPRTLDVYRYFLGSDYLYTSSCCNI